VAHSSGAGFGELKASVVDSEDAVAVRSVGTEETVAVTRTCDTP
jgi:hypothetical protein